MKLCHPGLLRAILSPFFSLAPKANCATEQVLQDFVFSKGPAHCRKTKCCSKIPFTVMKIHSLSLRLKREVKPMLTLTSVAPDLW